MKKLLKGLTCIAMAFVLVFGLSACKQNLSATTVNTEKVGVSNGVSTNGGMTAVYDGYLYFINGTKTNDGTSSSGNTKSAICRVKFDETLGTVNDATYEVVVDDLVGFTYGSLYFFGDFMYYATPSSEVNYKNSVLYYKTKFMRYDLVNKQKQTIYTTKQNSEDESLTFAYYVVGEELDFVVYESQSSTITSIKIGDGFSTNYCIEEVSSCVMSENLGKCETTGKTYDANSFVFYTKSYGTYDKYSGGVKVYRTLPNQNTSTCIFDQGETVTLKTIKNGKLVYSYSSLDVEMIFASLISGESNEKLDVKNTNNVISYNSIDDALYIANEDGSISILSYTAGDDSFNISYITVKNGTQIVNEQICYGTSKPSKFKMTSLVEVTEVVKEAEGETPAVTERVKYLIYVSDNVVYKLEIFRNNVLNKNTEEPVKLSKSKIVEPSGLLLPEVVGNYVFALANEIDDDEKETGSVYLHKIDLTIKEDSKEYSPVVAIVEE